VAKLAPVYFPAPPAAPHAVFLQSFSNLDALVPARHSWVEFFRGVTPSPHVDTPAGLAFHGGCLYICDTGYNVVHRWDLATGRAVKLGARGEPALVKPVDVAVDDRDMVYVADTGLGAVVAFDAAGTARRRFQPPGRAAYRPSAVAVGGTWLYVSDLATHTIDVFSTTDGSLQTTLGGPGDAAGRFFFPTGLAVTDDARLWVADMLNARVQVFDAEQRPVLTIGRPGDRYGDLGKPKRVALGPDGVVFVADVDFAYVHLFDREGRLLMLLGGPDDRRGGTPMPVGLAVAPTLPAGLTGRVPADFRADYFVFVANSVGDARLSLYALGTAR
jgi:DNA-binding beta-propeller fold protein YncE